MRSMIVRCLALLAACAVFLLLSPSVGYAGSPTFVIEPTSGPPGTVIDVWGDDWKGYEPGFPIQVNTDRGNRNGGLVRTIGAAIVDADGNFCAQDLKIPADAPLGRLTISGMTGTDGGPSASFMVTQGNPSGSVPTPAGRGRTDCRP